MSIIFSIFKEKKIMEDYKEIPGYPNYGISTAGEVKNLKKQKLLTNSIHKSTGYARVVLSNNGIAKSIYVHHLMSIVYLNHMPYNRIIVIDHINNNKLDNKLDNLQIITQRQNVTKSRNRNLPTGVFTRNNGKYQAGIRIKYKMHYLGTFNTLEEASNAYQQKLKEI